MKKQIIAIGGGGFGRSLGNLKIEQYILDQVPNKDQKKPLKISFLPQASAEDSAYISRYYEAFIKLGAIPSWQSLFGRVEDGWEDRLLEQDVIYVGGGNTKSMIALWREWGVDKVLQKAYDKGIVLAGVSAGAICWFEQACTDSVWPLGSVDGLGFLPGSCCPHYDGELERRPAYMNMVKNNEIIPGLALQDLTMGHYIDGELFKVVIAADTKQAFWVDHSGESSIKDKLFLE